MDPTQISPGIAETLLATMCIVGHHARRMTVALLWGLVVWLALIVFTLVLVIH